MNSFSAPNLVISWYKLARPQIWLSAWKKKHYDLLGKKKLIFLFLFFKNCLHEKKLHDFVWPLIILHYYFFFRFSRNHWQCWKQKQQPVFNRIWHTGLSSLGVPGRFWQISWPYLNQEGQTMPTTLQLVPTDFQTILRPNQYGFFQGIYFWIIFNPSEHCASTTRSRG